MNLNQVTIPVKDVEASIKFYQKLGLELIVRSLPNYARFVCPDGNSTFSLHKAEELITGQGAWIYFEVEDVDSKYNDLRLKDVSFETSPEDMPWLWRECRLRDPDSNQLIIYHAGKNRIDPPWKL